MKITIALLLITLGLVCSAYAAPASTKAEIQLLGTLFKHVAKSIPHVIGAIGGGEAQDYDDDDDNENGAQIEAVMQRLKDQAELQGFMDFMKKAGKLGMKVAPHVIGALTGGKAQDYDDNNDAEAQRLGTIIEHAIRLLGKK